MDAPVPFPLSDDDLSGPARGRPRTSLPGGRGITSISHRHEAIANWLILNPQATLAECAEALNYSRGAIYYIVNSDAFKSLMEKKNQQVFSTICNLVPQKLSGLAEMAIDKVMDHLEASDSPEFALSVFDKTLNRLGYGPARPAAPQPVIQNNLVISANDLAAARGAIIDSSEGSQVGNPGEPSGLLLEASKDQRQEEEGR
jgi:hypothetical protein